jgi:tetratricopeptide (TPR) repeat protein
MNRALAVESTPSRHFFLGLAYRRANNPDKALVHLKEAVAREPLNDAYVLALGYALHKAGKLRDSIRTLEPVARRSPDYLNTVRDLGYFYLQDSDNGNAALWFRKAIDNGPLYSQRTEAEVLSVRRDLYRMRSEIRTINNRYDLAAYLAHRSNADLGTASVLGGGVLPSQGGLEFGYQPAKIGFRAGRVFQLTGRLLWNTEPGSLRFDTDYFQAGLGVRYKPIPRQNLFVSGERIFRIGDATSSGLLWRGMYSWTRGRDLAPGRRIRNYSLLFGDAGYLTPNGGTTAFYSEIHQGAAFRAGSGALLKPHFVVDGRYQNRDVPRGSYVEAGGGLSLHLLFSETRYEVHRVGLEFLLHYKRAWLQPNPELQGDRIFNGWTITSLILF